MINALASFKFVNSQYELMEEAKNDIYVKLERHMLYSNRIAHGAPLGTIQGYQTKIEILHRGKPNHHLVWELSSNRKTIAADVSLQNIIPLPISYDDQQKYQIKIYPTLSHGVLEHPIKVPKKMDKLTAVQVIISSINSLIIDTLSKLLPKHTIKYGSSHLDGSGNNDKYFKSVRIEALDKPLFHIYVYYADAYYIDLFTFYGPNRSIDIKTILWDINVPDWDGLYNELETTITANDTYVDTLRSSPVASL